MVLVTGDVAACAEASSLIPGIETVAVKKGLSRFAAVAIPPERSRAMIRQGACASLARTQHIAPLRLPPPYVWRDELFSQIYEPGVARAGNATVIDCNSREFRADNIIDLVRQAFGYA
jgi:D-amino peptidase